MAVKFNIIWFLVNLMVICEANDGPVVCFSEGCARGVSYENYDAFLGIPFAKPPINELRFKVKTKTDRDV
jgi:hypothetical protein